MNQSEITEKALGFFKDAYDKPKAIGITNNGEKVKIRLFKSSNPNGEEIGFFKKNSRKRGYILSYLNLSDIFLDCPTKQKKPESKQWEDAWNKVLSKLQESGLWPEIQKEILLVNTDKIRQITERKIRSIAKEIYWQKQLEAWNKLLS